MKFGNGSSIRVGTSLRSGTFQRLHVSEYGKLCAKFPEKAREVKSGALNTVHVGQKIRIESTAEGQAGHFYELCQKAQNMERQGVALTDLDFKQHFFGWYLDEKYQLDADVLETSEMREYFDKLEAEGVVLTKPQRAWYVKKSEQQDDDMKREFPIDSRRSVRGIGGGGLLPHRDAQDAPTGPHLPHPDPQQAGGCLLGLGRR
jgi:hypothetical protein